jgi:hypothetical protein
MIIFENLMNFKKLFDGPLANLQRSAWLSLDGSAKRQCPGQKHSTLVRPAQKDKTPRQAMSL